MTSLFFHMLWAPRALVSPIQTEASPLNTMSKQLSTFPRCQWFQHCCGLNVKCVHPTDSGSECLNFCSWCWFGRVVRVFRGEGLSARSKSLEVAFQGYSLFKSFFFFFLLPPGLLWSEQPSRIPAAKDWSTLACLPCSEKIKYSETLSPQFSIS